MADTKLTYTIPEGKAAEYIADYIYVHKNTETEVNPDYVDEETTPEVDKTIPKYTDGQWVKEHILRSIRAQIVRGKNAQTRDNQESVNADDVV